METLSFGLKFATCIHKNITINTILRNCKNCDTDFSRGFTLGIIHASVSQPNDLSRPKLYIYIGTS